MTTDERALPRGRFDSYTSMLKASVAKKRRQNFEHIARQAYIGLGLQVVTSSRALKVDSCPAEGFNPKLIDEVLGLEKLGPKKHRNHVRGCLPIQHVIGLRLWQKSTRSH